MNIGERLKNVREDKDLKQTEVAKAIHITNKVLSSYERNICLPTIENLIALCNYYHISADSIQQTEYYISSTSPKSKINTNATTASLSAEQKRVLYYYSRLNEENRDAIKGLMVTYYKDQIKGQK